MENLLQQDDLVLPSNRSQLKLYGVNTSGANPADGQFPASDILSIGNLASQEYIVNAIDWSGDLQEYARIWNAVNASTTIFLVRSNQTLYFRTKRIVFDTVNPNDYTVIVRRWRETRKYSNESAVVSIGGNSQITLSPTTSRLALEHEERYSVVDGEIVNGFTQPLGDVTDIAQSVNSLGVDLFPQQDEILFSDNANTFWIYQGQAEIIGQSGTTVPTDFLELVPENVQAEDEPLPYASLEQGALADSALQPDGDGSQVTGVNANLLRGLTPDDGVSPNTIVQRTAAGDIIARIYRTTFATDDVINIDAQVFMRNSNGSDNAGRPISKVGFKNWLYEATDTPWADLPLTSGVTGTIQYKRKNGRIIIEGDVSNNTGNEITSLGTLPSAFRPTRNRRFVVNIDEITGQGLIFSGQMLITIPTGTTLAIDIEFTQDTSD